jgi:hypothetical protein
MEARCMSKKGETFGANLSLFLQYEESFCDGT